MTTPADVANAVLEGQKATVSLGSWPTWLTFFAVVIGLVTAYIKGIPARTKAESDADASLRADERLMRVQLSERIAALELKVDQNEADCAKRIEDALRANDERWQLRMDRIQLDYEQKIKGLTLQIQSLQSDTGKVMRLAGGSHEPSTSMERVAARAISEIADRLDPPTVD